MEEQSQVGRSFSHPVLKNTRPLHVMSLLTQAENPEGLDSLQCWHNALLRLHQPEPVPQTPAMDPPQALQAQLFWEEGGQTLVTC